MMSMSSSCVQRTEDGLAALGSLSGEGDQHMADVSDTQILSPCPVVPCHLKSNSYVVAWTGVL